MRDALECAGLVVHEGKSVWFPSLSTAWLGIVADLEWGCVSVPEAKLAVLCAMLQITGVVTHLNATKPTCLYRPSQLKQRYCGDSLSSLIVQAENIM